MHSSAVSATLASLLMALALSPADAKPAHADPAAIKASIASPDRPQADRERDEWAKPETVLNFLGARPGMQVIDYFAGDGYYSELLARIVGEKGKVIVYNNGGYAGFVGQELVKRFADKRVPNTSLRVAEIPNLKLADKSLDAALFVMSYHDVYYTPEGAKSPMGDVAQMLGGLFDALKPGWGRGRAGSRGERG